MFSAAPIHSAVFFITHNPREIEEYYHDINERYCLTEFRSRVKKLRRKAARKLLNILKSEGLRFYLEVPIKEPTKRIPAFLPHDTKMRWTIKIFLPGCTNCQLKFKEKPLFRKANFVHNFVFLFSHLRQKNVDIYDLSCETKND